MTYEELGALMNCDAAEARSAAQTMQLDRRRSRDGRTRAKLNLMLTEVFIDRLVRDGIMRELDSCVGDLRTMRDRMGAARPAAGETRTSAAG